MKPAGKTRPIQVQASFENSLNDHQIRLNWKIAALGKTRLNKRTNGSEFIKERLRELFLKLCQIWENQKIFAKLIKSIKFINRCLRRRLLSMPKDTWWEEWPLSLPRNCSADRESSSSEPKKSSSADSFITEELSISNGRTKSPIATQEREDPTTSRPLPSSSGDALEECSLTRPPEERLPWKDSRFSRAAPTHIPMPKRPTFPRHWKSWDLNLEENSASWESCANLLDGTKGIWFRSWRRKDWTNPSPSTMPKSRSRKRSSRFALTQRKFSLLRSSSPSMDINKY